MEKIKQLIIGTVGLSLVFMAGLVMAENVKTQEISRAVIKIDTLSRGECFSAINESFSPLEGYLGMGANLFRKLIAIDFAAPLTPEKISQTLSEIGYPGKLESVDIILEKESFAYLEYRRTGVLSGKGCCSLGGSPADKIDTRQEPDSVQNSPGLIPPSGESCCSLSDGSQSTENL